MTHIRFDLSGDDEARLKSLASDMGMSPAAAARELLIGALHDDAFRHPRIGVDGFKGYWNDQFVGKDEKARALLPNKGGKRAPNWGQP